MENKRKEQTYSVVVRYAVTVSARNSHSAVSKAIDEIEEGLWEPDHTETDL